MSDRVAVLTLRRWQSEITAWKRSSRFVDRQTGGSYTLWVHERTFADQNGGTLIEDHVI